MKLNIKHTFGPLSIYLTAQSSPLHISLTNLATPKFPDPISFSISYRSIICSLLLQIYIAKIKEYVYIEVEQSLCLCLPLSFYLFALSISMFFKAINAKICKLIGLELGCEYQWTFTQYILKKFRSQRKREEQEELGSTGGVMLEARISSRTERS